MPRVIIDTDAGVDDALALLLALRSPELDVAAITTVSGNAPVHHCIANVRRVLDVLGGPAPLLFQGESAPISRPLFTAPEVHGEDGLGGASLLREADGSPRYPEAPVPVSPHPAWEALVEMGRAEGPALTLIALGPLTNVARAIERDAAAVRAYRRIVIMGGACRVSGNTSAVAEFNIYVDPEAAQRVLQLGAPITLVPLDVTERAVLRGDQLGELAPAPRVARFVEDITAAYMRYHAQADGLAGCFLHDPLAVGAVLWPDLLGARPLRVDVETQGTLTRGMTVADFRPGRGACRPPNADVCLEVNAGEFVRRFLAHLATPA
ncbi:MAG: nucleoside hydrolase [Armatimonadetes bacterium]|nr:nucleoside hydrolase [Armatimonadota bacterium]